MAIYDELLGLQNSKRSIAQGIGRGAFHALGNIAAGIQGNQYNPAQAEQMLSPREEVDPMKLELAKAYAKEHAKNMFAKPQADVPADEKLPEGLWRDPVSQKIIKIPAVKSASGAITAEGGTVPAPLSPMMQKQKSMDAKNVIASTQQNALRRDMIAQAQESANRIPTGLTGKFKMGAMKAFDPNNPIMQDWQNIKMVLTDAQLMNTAKTKGAVSDREMALFAQAAANDDIASVQAMKPVFNKLLKVIDAENKSNLDAFKYNYGEDLASTLGEQSPVPQPMQQGGRKEGGVNMTDANGNVAIVYPDGSYEEIQ